MPTKTAVSNDGQVPKQLRTFAPTKKGRDLGFIAYHTGSGKPIPDKQLDALYEHVLGPASRAIEERIRKGKKHTI
jgi:hypothetical protein